MLSWRQLPVKSLISEAGSIKFRKSASLNCTSARTWHFSTGCTAQVGGKTTLRFVNTVHAGYHEGDEVGVMQMQSQVGMHHPCV
jgi:hypothetical protein